MRTKILLYGLLLALLVLILKLMEYRFLVRDFSLEFYLGMVALFFALLGTWIGSRIVSVKYAPTSVSSTVVTKTEEQIRKAGISRREFEVLELMSKGNSNQEIADQLFVSLNTVKTHAANLFVKLNAKRRTQAIQRAKDLGIIS